MRGSDGPFALTVDVHGAGAIDSAPTSSAGNSGDGRAPVSAELGGRARVPTECPGRPRDHAGFGATIIGSARRLWIERRRFAGRRDRPGARRGAWVLNW